MSINNDILYKIDYEIGKDKEVVKLKKEIEKLKQDIEYFSNKLMENTNYWVRTTDERNELQNQLQQKENIIKEVREYIENDMKKYGGDIYITCKDILGILEKEK